MRDGYSFGLCMPDAIRTQGGCTVARDEPRHLLAVSGRSPRDLRLRMVDRSAADAPVPPVPRDDPRRFASLPALPLPVHLEEVYDEAARANGLPSLSRQMAQRSPGWITVPPSSAIRSRVAGRSATVKEGGEGA